MSAMTTYLCAENDEYFEGIDSDFFECEAENPEKAAEKFAQGIYKHKMLPGEGWLKLSIVVNGNEVKGQRIFEITVEDPTSYCPWW